MNHIQGFLVLNKSDMRIKKFKAFCQNDILNIISERSLLYSHMSPPGGPTI